MSKLEILGAGVLWLGGTYAVVVLSMWCVLSLRPNSGLEGLALANIIVIVECVVSVVGLLLFIGYRLHA